MNQLETLYFKSHIKANLLMIAKSIMGTVASDTEKKIIVNYNKKDHKMHFSSNIILILNAASNQMLDVITTAVIQAITTDPLYDDFFIAHNGFLNFNLVEDYYQDILLSFQESNLLDFYKGIKKPKISFELVSANPTGELHAGHLRNGCISDSLINIFKYTNHCVNSVFYVNDYGRQINNMSLSLYIYYLKVLDQSLAIDFPSDVYQNKIYKKAAQEFFLRYKDKYVSLISVDEIKNNDIDYSKLILFKDFGVKFFLDYFEKLLDHSKIKVDKWFFESSIYQKNLVSEMITKFKQKRILYEHDGAWWLKTTCFGDDKDRVFIKSDGSYTYMVSDIIYHYLRQKQHDRLIDVWGSDHHGYTTRVKAGLSVVYEGKVNFQVVTTQLVSLLVNNKSHKLSKRKNIIVTLEELVTLLGVDCTRFYMVKQSPNSPLILNVEAIRSDANNSDYFYCQYAYVRCLKLLDNAADLDLRNVNFANLNNLDKSLLIRAFNFFDVINNIILLLDPSLLVKYTLDLAKLFHYFYNKERIINVDDLPKTKVKLSLVAVVKLFIEYSFKLLNIDPLTFL